MCLHFLVQFLPWLTIWISRSSAQVELCLGGINFTMESLCPVPSMAIA